MYLPKYFLESDPNAVVDLIRENPFATLITQAAGQPFVGFIPLLGKPKSVATATELPLSLEGHMARANPQWRHFADQEVIVLFHGPHAFVSATWYPDGVVPTWNYANVQIRGKARIVDDQGLDAILDRTLKTFEANPDPEWRKRLSPEELIMKSKSIVGFEIEILAWEAKFKLSQNRPIEDAEGVIRGLEQDPATNGPVLRWMYRSITGRHGDRK